MASFGGGQPFDYSTVAVDPMTNYTHGVQQASNAINIERADAEYKRNEDVRNQVQALMTSGRPITSAEIAPLIANANPELSQQIAKAHGLLTVEQQQNKLKIASQVLSALQSGDTPVAIKTLEEQREAAKNSGDVATEHGAQLMIDQINIDPRKALMHIAVGYGSIPGFDKLLDLSAEVAKKPFEQRKLEAETQSAESRAAADPGYYEARNTEINAKANKENAAANAASSAQKAEDIVANDPSLGAQIKAGTPINQVVKGYGKEASAVAMAARKDAIRQIMEETGMTAEEAGRQLAVNQSSFKAESSSVAQQEKNLGAMGSFVKNIDKQVNRFEEIAKDVSTFDTRLLNIPRRELAGKVKGSAMQSKMDMYVAEVSSEVARLASGNAASIAELSQGLREKWDKIHDNNLSINDLLSVLKESKHAGNMRYDSVKEQIKESKGKMGDSGSSSNSNIIKVINPDTKEEETWNTKTGKRVK